MVGMPAPEERVFSFAADINNVVDRTSSRIEELEKRVEKEEAFRDWLRDLDNHSIQNCVSFFVTDRGYGPWYRREAWEHVKTWECTPHATDLFDYLHHRFPRLGS